MEAGGKNYYLCDRVKCGNLNEVYNSNLITITMKKILLFATAVLLAAGCVDNKFDLSDIDTGDISIGSDKTELKMPLGTIKVMGDALQSEGTYDSLDAIFEEADAWIPSGMTSLSISTLALGVGNKDHDDYVDDIVNELMKDVRENKDGKRDVVVDIIAHNKSYTDAIIPRDPITGDPLYSLDEAGVKDYINNHLSDFEKDSREILKDIIEKHLESLTTSVEDISAEIDGFGQDTVDMLSTEGSSISLDGTITNNLPLTASGTIVFTDKQGNELNTPTKIKLVYGQTAELNFTLTAADIKKMADDMDLVIRFGLEDYFPRTNKPFGADDVALEMELKLIRKGGVNLGDVL